MILRINVRIKIAGVFPPRKKYILSYFRSSYINRIFFDLFPLIHWLQFLSINAHSNSNTIYTVKILHDILVSIRPKYKVQLFHLVNLFIETVLRKRDCYLL